MKQEAQLPQR